VNLWALVTIEIVMSERDRLFVLCEDNNNDVSNLETCLIAHCTCVLCYIGLFNNNIDNCPKPIFEKCHERDVPTSLEGTAGRTVVEWFVFYTDATHPPHALHDAPHQIPTHAIRMSRAATSELH